MFQTSPVVVLHTVDLGMGKSDIHTHIHTPCPYALTYTHTYTHIHTHTHTNIHTNTHTATYITSKVTFKAILDYAGIVPGTSSLSGIQNGGLDALLVDMVEHSCSLPDHPGEVAVR